MNGFSSRNSVAQNTSDLCPTVSICGCRLLAPFILRPSSFSLHLGVALRWLWGRIEVAFGSHSGHIRVAMGWLSCGYVHHLYSIRTRYVHDPYTMSTGLWMALNWL